MNENICSICYEELNNEDNNIHTLECNHCYHSSCIIKWFRNGNNNCPLCNDSTIDTNMSDYTKIETIKEIKKLGRRKSCPDNIKETLELIKKYKEEEVNATKIYREFKKTNKSIYNMERKLQRNKWKNRRKIIRLEHKLLSLITIRPIYIKNN